jgi:hypothetical protein
MPKPNQSRAESYLIRLWRDREYDPWRASLQNIRSGEVRHFSCPEELWAYLQAEMADKRRRAETSGLHQRQS